MSRNDLIFKTNLLVNVLELSRGETPQMRSAFPSAGKQNPFSLEKGLE